MLLSASSFQKRPHHSLAPQKRRPSHQPQHRPAVLQALPCGLRPRASAPAVAGWHRDADRDQPENGASERVGCKEAGAAPDSPSAPPPLTPQAARYHAPAFRPDPRRKSVGPHTSPSTAPAQSQRQPPHTIPSTAPFPRLDHPRASSGILTILPGSTPAARHPHTASASAITQSSW